MAPRPRALHLIDIENIIGDLALHDRSDPAAALTAYRQRVGIHDGDAAVIGASGRTARFLVGTDLTGMHLRVARGGPDAADRILLDEADPDFVVRRFPLLVIGSGDGIFASLARKVSARGVATWLVTGRGGVSRELARSCRIRTWLALPPAPGLFRTA